MLDSAELVGHPLADVLPLMDGTVFEELVRDIELHGQRDPIILFEGMILDGRNRYRACQLAGIACRTEEWDGKGSPVAFVISKNVQRRHLTDSQRTMIAAELATMVRGDVAAQKTDPPNGGSLLTTGEAAALLDVPLRSVERAKRVLREGTAAEIAEIKSGHAPISSVDRRISDWKRAEDGGAVETLRAPAEITKPTKENVVSVTEKAVIEPIDGTEQTLVSAALSAPPTAATVEPAAIEHQAEVARSDEGVAERVDLLPKEAARVRQAAERRADDIGSDLGHVLLSRLGGRGNTPAADSLAWYIAYFEERWRNASSETRDRFASLLDSEGNIADEMVGLIEWYLSHTRTWSDDDDKIVLAAAAKREFLAVIRAKVGDPAAPTD